MSLKAPRREENPNLIFGELGKWQRLNARVWSYIYKAVAIITYLVMLVCLGMTLYYNFIDFDFVKVLINALLTVLVIYVNRVNPK